MKSDEVIMLLGAFILIWLYSYLFSLLPALILSTWWNFPIFVAFVVLFVACWVAVCAVLEFIYIHIFLAIKEDLSAEQLDKS